VDVFTKLMLTQGFGAACPLVRNLSLGLREVVQPKLGVVASAACHLCQ
jgi:hypothetical protein